MRITVTGKEGQVVRALVERGAIAGHEVVAVGRPELDLARDSAGVTEAIAATRPDVIVSAAAFTAVDEAESQSDLAFLINERGAAAVAAAARELDVPLIHLSTDYVFDGLKREPYLESDATGPTSVYGASKLAGERAVLAVHDNVAVLRTAWVYSPFGGNFVRTMLRLAGVREAISVVDDQLGNPTSALDIADGVIAVARNLVADRDAAKRGIFHMTASGQASWASFAEAIFDASRSAGGPSASVLRIGSADYPTPARRPTNSRLAQDKLAAVHGVRLPDWQNSMADVVARLVRGDPQKDSR